MKRILWRGNTFNLTLFFWLEQFISFSAGLDHDTKFDASGPLGHIFFVGKFDQNI